MKVKEFFTELVWDSDEKDWEISKSVDTFINEWLNSVNVEVIDIKYNVNVVGENCTQSQALVLYKECEVNNVPYCEILSQDKRFIRYCNGVKIIYNGDVMHVLIGLLLMIIINIY